MKSISANIVRKLREITGAGMMDCKKALVETSGDIDAAIQVIKKKGLKIAELKHGRSSNECRYFIAIDENFRNIAYINLTAETDFVAKNEKFQNFGQLLANKLLSLGSDSFNQAINNGELKDSLLKSISEMGENITIAESKIISGEFIGYYLHNTQKILAIIECTTDISTDKHDQVQQLLKDVAMHIAANRVEAIDEKQIPINIINAEKEVFTQLAANKPKEVIEKIVQGQLNKFKKDIVLNLQPFLKNNDITVKEHIDVSTKKLGGTLNINNFYKLVV